MEMFLGNVLGEVLRVGARFFTENSSPEVDAIRSWRELGIDYLEVLQTHREVTLAVPSLSVSEVGSSIRVLLSKHFD